MDRLLEWTRHPAVTPKTAWAVLRKIDGADALLGTLALLALRQCLRGRGSPLIWIAAAFFVIGLRLLVSPCFRRRTTGALRQSWNDLEAFAADGKKLPWRGAFVFALLPVAVLYLSNDWYAGTLDSRPVIPTSVSLLNDGDFELSEFSSPRRLAAVCPEMAANPALTCIYGPLPYFFAQTRTGIYSRYPSGMAAFALPVVAAARLAGARLYQTHVILRLEKLTAGLVAASSAALFLLIALHLAPFRPALAMTLILASGSALYSTASQALWQHDGVIFWTLVLLLIEFRRTNCPSRVGMVLQGIACGMMLGCRVTALLVLGPFFLWILVREPKRALATFEIGLLAFAPWAMLGLIAYDSPVGLYGAVNHPWWWAKRIGYHWYAVLFSPGRGLIVYQPWIVLGWTALLPAVRRRLAAVGRVRGPAGWVWFCLAAVTAEVALISSWRMWGGGICWGSRLLTDVVPLCALLCVKPVAVFWQHTMGKRLVLAVGLLSFWLHVSGIHFKALRWNDGTPNLDHHQKRMKSWSDPPFLFVKLR